MKPFVEFSFLKISILEFLKLFFSSKIMNVCHALFHLEKDILHFLLFYVPDRFILC